MQNSDSLSSKPGAPIRVAVDAMGGDYAPQETVKGAVAALEQGDVELLLVGDAEAVEAELTKYGRGRQSGKGRAVGGENRGRRAPDARLSTETGGVGHRWDKVGESRAGGRAGIARFHRGINGHGGVGAGSDGRVGAALHWRAISGTGAPGRF